MKHQVVLQTIFSFFGPPGSGKGTLAQKLVQRLDFQMLSTGNLFREHVANGTGFGNMLDQYLKKGLLIPDDLVTDMVIDWVKTKSKPDTPIILDGFPRTEGQAARFFDFLKNSLKYQFRVVLVELAEDKIVQRLSRRLVCSNKHCQTPFTERAGLTNCEICNGLLIKRNDDKEEVVRERLKSYPEYRDALLNFYADNGQSMEALNVENLHPEQVYDLFVQRLNLQDER